MTDVATGTALETPADPLPGSFELVAEASFGEVTRELRGAQRRMSRMAVTLISVAITFSVIAVWIVFLNTSAAIETVKANPDNPYVFFFELVRSGSFAALVGGFVWVLFALGRQSLDQSVRYEKRLMAAHFMNFVVARYDSQLRESKIKIGDVSSFLTAWSATVESAFTKGRIPPEQSREPFGFKFGPDGVEMSANQSGKKTKP